MLFALSVMACSENNIAYDEVINVPQGIYLSGSSSEFSLPIETGRLRAVESDNENMLSIRAWLMAVFRYRLSILMNSPKPMAWVLNWSLLMLMPPHIA